MLQSPTTLLQLVSLCRPAASISIRESFLESRRPTHTNKIITQDDDTQQKLKLIKSPQIFLRGSFFLFSLIVVFVVVLTTKMNRLSQLASCCCCTFTTFPLPFIKNTHKLLVSIMIIRPKKSFEFEYHLLVSKAQYVKTKRL